MWVVTLFFFYIKHFTHKNYMKKILTAALLLISTIASAQVNVQLHYDLGRAINPEGEPNRPNVTTTVEMFRADKLGSTYFFTDFDYFSDGVGGAYWEVSREFTFAKAKNNSSFAAHVEYDGGLSINKYAGESGSRFQQAALVGPAWNWHSSDFSKTFSLQAMYKQYFRKRSDNLDPLASFQVTTVWGVTFADGLCTCSGFADLWHGYIPRFNAEGKQKKGLVFISEPQFWFNVMGKNRQNDKLSIGTEIELSDNFIWAGNSKTFFVNPTLAVKYTF